MITRGSSSINGGASIIGNAALNHLYVEFDRAQSRVGFAQRSASPCAVYGQPRHPCFALVLPISRPWFLAHFSALCHPLSRRVRRSCLLGAGVTGACNPMSMTHPMTFGRIQAVLGVSVGARMPERALHLERERERERVQRRDWVRQRGRRLDRLGRGHLHGVLDLDFYFYLGIIIPSLLRLYQWAPRRSTHAVCRAFVPSCSCPHVYIVPFLIFFVGGGHIHMLIGPCHLPCNPMWRPIHALKPPAPGVRPPPAPGGRHQVYRAVGRTTMALQVQWRWHLGGWVDGWWSWE